MQLVLESEMELNLDYIRKREIGSCRTNDLLPILYTLRKAIFCKTCSLSRELNGARPQILGPLTWDLNSQSPFYTKSWHQLIEPMQS